ncbi:MAG: branched-chain amino acid transaminase [Gemmatimonas sp.]|nr:branched-chain amino acid transaminase [Gemmatimonas sp.]
MSLHAFFEGEFVPQEEAKIGILTHAFNYGTAVMDGYRGFWNSGRDEMFLFRLRNHFDRFLANCKILRIQVAPTTDDLIGIAVELARRCAVKQDLLFRPLAYKASQSLGVRLHDLADALLISTTDMGPYLPETGVRCRTATWRRIPDISVPARAKITGLYVNNALARAEAAQDGYDEAVMLSENGHVSEAGPANVFIVRKHRVITPPVYDDILEGITRDTVISLARDELELEVVERPIDRSELYVADEAFLCGTANHMTPILEVDRRVVGEGEEGLLTAKLRGLYQEVARCARPDYEHWCTPVLGRP